MPSASLQDLLLRAESLAKTGRHAEAIAPLLEATRLAPNNADLLNNLGTAYLFARRLPEAIGWLRRSLALAPNSARAHYNLGLALQRAGDANGALVEFGRTAVLAPQVADAHARAGDILWEKGMQREATAAYEDAAAAAPATPLGLLAKAKALAAQDRRDEAEAALADVLVRDPKNGGAHLLLGRLLVDTGRFDDARPHFERAIELSPAQATAYHDLVASRRLTEADRPWLDAIEARLASPEQDAQFSPALAERQRMTLHFAAGKACDDLGDYAAAIAHFDVANVTRKKLGAADREGLARRVDRLLERFTPGFFASHASRDADETPLLVLGMPRAGTTLVERVLSSHPDVRGGGELGFWVDRAPAWLEADADLPAAERLREAYLALLRSIGPGARRVTDKMPFNFFWVGLVHLVLPRARFVHCRRDPVDTCLSIYTTEFKESWGFASDRGDLVEYYRQYRRLMDHWRAVLPADRLLEIDYEDATASPDATARRLVAFAGLPWDDACLAPEKNADAIKTASKWQARQPVYRSSVARWKRYAPWLGELRELRGEGRGGDRETGA